MIKLTLVCDDATGEHVFSAYAAGRSFEHCGTALDELWDLGKRHFVSILRDQVEIFSLNDVESVTQDERAMLAHCDAFSGEFFCHAFVLLFPDTCGVKLTVEDV